jgi:hypothetical protein
VHPYRVGDAIERAAKIRQEEYRRSRLHVVPRASGDDRHLVGCEWVLELERDRRVRIEPRVAVVASQDHRHGLGVHRPPQFVRLGGHEGKLCRAAYQEPDDARTRQQRIHRRKGPPLAERPRNAAQRGVRPTRVSAEAGQPDTHPRARLEGLGGAKPDACSMARMPLRVRVDVVGLKPSRSTRAGADMACGHDTDRPGRQRHPSLG